MFVTQKKIEIIVEVIKTSEVIHLIDELGLEGYSIIRNSEGRGTHGMRKGEEVADILINDYVIIICTNEEAQLLVNKIAPILEKFGGICCVSEVQVLNIK